MRSLVVFGCVSVALLFPMTAQAEIKGCYERVYEKAYLKKNRKQDVIKMRLQIGVGQGTDGAFELLDRVDAGFRKKPIYRGGLISCKTEGDELACNIEADGGGFMVTDRGENSVRITNTSEMRFGDDEDGIVVKGKGQNREFRLFRVSEGSCP